MEKLLSIGKMEGLRIEHLQRDGGYNLCIEHFHSYYEIYFLLSGNRFFFIQDRVFHVQPGNLVIINANQIHKIGPNEYSAHERILLRIDVSLMEDISRFLPGLDIESFFTSHAGVIGFSEEDQAAIQTMLFAVLDVFKEKRRGYESFAKVSLAWFFSHVINSEFEQSKAPNLEFTPPKAQKVHEIASYITEHYDEKLSLDAIAKRFYISKYYLCRMFKEMTGFTVNEYIHTNRIRNAQRLLRDECYNITQIAQEVGYESTTQFGKKFKDLVGVSPLQYRKTAEKKPVHLRQSSL